MSRAGEQFIAALDRFCYYRRPHSAEQQTSRAVRPNGKSGYREFPGKSADAIEHKKHYRTLESGLDWASASNF